MYNRGRMATAALTKRITSWAVSNANTTSLRCISTAPATTYFPSSSKSHASGCRTATQAIQSHHSPPRRYFSDDKSSWTEEYEGLIAQRNKNIIMNPKGHGQYILPGNFVLRKNAKTGAERKVLLEFALGYFWAFKELTLTNNKPILSNEAIIPAAEAEKFPTLNGLVNLHNEEVDVPDFFTRNNRSKDASAKCTLVAVSCKDFGARLLPSWTDPFEEAFCSGPDASRFDVVRMSINEGRMAKLLSPFILNGTKKNVPEKDHANTLLYYGDAEEMRDILRLHNVYTGYVFLVDGIGRVRWAGSGEGSEEEVQLMIDIAKLLTTPPKRIAPQKKLPSPRIGKRVPVRD